MHDITFKDITVYADDASVVKSIFKGHSPENDVKNVRISNYVLNGVKCDPVIEMNEFVSGVVIE